LKEKFKMKRSIPFLLYMPAIILIFAVTIFPLIYSLYMSFHYWVLGGEYLGHSFIGHRNYLNAFTDPEFWNSMRVTLIFVLGAVTLEFLLGILIFLALRIDVKGISIFRSLALVPMVVAPVAVGTIWRILYDPDYGIINYIISLLGFSPQMWLADPRMALFSVMLVDVWEWTPLIILFLLAGYQALPRDYIEAAHVDGASLIQELRYIILPLLSPIIGGILILRLIDAFKTMDTIFIMTWGGPGTATEVASVFIYKIGFRYMDVGKAAATSYILLLMISILLIVWTKYSRRGT